VELKRFPIKSLAFRAFRGLVLAVARDDPKVPDRLLNGDGSLGRDMPVTGRTLHRHSERPRLAVLVDHTTLHSGREQKQWLVARVFVMVVTVF